MSDGLAFLRAAQAAPAPPAPGPARRRLVRDTAGRWDWTDQAACVDLPTELFYPWPTDPLDGRVVEACRTCPVLAQCREHAVVHELDGFWGGLDEAARHRLRKARGLGTPSPPQPVGPRDLDPLDPLDPSE